MTFWVNHNGLGEVSVEGEVGFGDMARLLMRRRANAPLIRRLRDRFTYSTRDMEAIETPDTFRAEITEDGFVWRNRPEQIVVAQGLIGNLPLIVKNATSKPAEVEASFAGSSGIAALESRFGPSELPAHGTAGYFLEVVETKAGSGSGRLSLRANQARLESAVELDVRPLVRLRVQLLDERGQPAAARVYITASDGLAYTPRGTASRITAMSSEYYFHAENSFEIELPSGPALIEATRGLEYELTGVELDLRPERPEAIRLRLKRWEHMAAKGWYSSDAHIHANYTAVHHQVIRPEDVRRQALAEDLNMANMMVANSGGSFLHDLEHFEGKPHVLSGPSHLIYWNEEMRNRGLYGHMCFYNLKNLVYPLYTGFAGTPQWEDYPPNYVQAKAAQQQGGAVTYAHPIGGGGQPGVPTGERLPTGLPRPTVVTSFETAGVKELPVDLALGQIDALDVFSNADEIGSMELWYALLNCGFRLAVSAGSDAFTNVVDHYTMGGGRVYARLDGPLRYQQWVQSYKQGRSFATNGPMISFTVDGKEPGAELRFAEEEPRNVRVKATVRSQVPVEKVEVVVNGEVVKSGSPSEGRDFSLDEEIPLTRSSWVAVRAYGRWQRLVLNDLQTFAHTSPVYVYLGDQPVASLKDLRFYIDWIEKLIRRVEERGRFETPAKKREVVDLFQRALRIYRDRERAAGGG